MFESISVFWRSLSGSPSIWAQALAGNAGQLGRGACCYPHTQPPSATWLWAQAVALTSGLCDASGLSLVVSLHSQKEGERAAPGVSAPLIQRPRLSSEASSWHLSLVRAVTATPPCKDRALALCWTSAPSRESKAVSHRRWSHPSNGERALLPKDAVGDPGELGT